MVKRRTEGLYLRALASTAAFVAVGLFVKYAELLWTPEHRDQIPTQGTLISRLSQWWMSLRFSWQELAIGAVLTALLIVLRRLAPTPGRAVRASVQTLRVALGVLSLLAVFGIAYYSIYQTHFSADDLAFARMAPQLLSTVNPLQLLSVKLGLLFWVCVTVGLPWAAVRCRLGFARVATFALLVMSVAATVTYAAGRPNLAEASLEPDPSVWILTGHRVSYLGLPPPDQLAPIGEQRPRYQVSTRPKNVILIIMESTSAAAVFPYNVDALAGRKLFDDFEQNITVFENIFATVPVSNSSFVELMTGRIAVPTNAIALAESAGLPTFPELLKARGFSTEMLMNNFHDPIITRLAERGFDRFRETREAWPGKEKYAKTQWGYDDRFLFDQAQAVIRAQTSSSPPLFLTLYSNNAHAPYDTASIPGLGAVGDARERYRRLVEHDFDLVAETYAAVQRAGLADSTAIFIFGDHGEAFGEHAGNFIHSKTLFAENLHVPLLLLYPQRFGLPARISQLGSLSDILPTTCDLLGIAVSGRAGMSLLNEAPNRIIFGLTEWGPGEVALRDRRFTYILSRNGRELLFDRTADPGEHTNVLGAFPDVAASFRARLTTGAVDQ